MIPRHSIRLALVLLALVALALGIALRSVAAETGPALLTATFLDVGQGDAIWVQAPDGEDILIDGGPEAAGPRVVAYLQSHGCADIEHMALTHPHADHVGGLIAVLDSIPTQELWYTGEAYSTLTYERFLGLVEEKSITATIQSAGDVDMVGGLQLAVLHPATLSTEPNNNSLVYRISYGQTDLLLTGDIEAGVEDSLLHNSDNLQSEVLKVAHHGADTSSTDAFLQAVSPACAVISVGASNPYGHPSPDVLSRLAALPTTVYRTDLDGTVRVVSDGTTVTVDISHYLRFVFLPFVARQSP